MARDEFLVADTAERSRRTADTLIERTAYNGRVDPQLLREFARRDWNAAADHALDYWADQFARSGGEPARSVSTGLFLHAKTVIPDYPSASDRADDLAHHQQLRDRLDRAARALARR
jgi:hypothetical protein